MDEYRSRQSFSEQMMTKYIYMLSDEDFVLILVLSIVKSAPCRLRSIDEKLLWSFDHTCEVVESNPFSLVVS